MACFILLLLHWCMALAADDDLRLDLCGRRHEIVNGRRSLDKAVSLFDDHFITYNAASGEYGGYLAKLMNAVATKGNFSYTYVQQTVPTTYTAWLFASIQTFDLNGIYWVETVDRMKTGAACPYPFLDTSMYFYVKNTVVHHSFWDRVFNFTRPFVSSVWVIFVSIALVTGVMYLIFEHHTNERDGINGRILLGLENAIYLSCFQVTQGGGFQPTTAAGKLLAVSWAWCVLLFAASYTGSIASLFVNDRSQGAFASIDAFIGSGHHLCTWGAGNDFVRSRFPTYSNLVKSTRNPVLDLVDGKCTAALVEKVFIDLAKNNKKLNPNCLLETVGSPVLPAYGGWMVGTEYGKCSAIITQCMEQLFFELREENVLKMAYDDMIALSADSTACVQEEELDTTKLTVAQSLARACEVSARRASPKFRQTKLQAQSNTISATGQVCATLGFLDSHP